MHFIQIPTLCYINPCRRRFLRSKSANFPGESKVVTSIAEIKVDLCWRDEIISKVISMGAISLACVSVRLCSSYLASFRDLYTIVGIHTHQRPLIVQNKWCWIVSQRSRSVAEWIFEWADWANYGVREHRITPGRPYPFEHDVDLDLDLTSLITCGSKSAFWNHPTHPTTRNPLTYLE